jgi:hypothetical protein
MPGKYTGSPGGNEIILSFESAFEGLFLFWSVTVLRVPRLARCKQIDTQTQPAAAMEANKHI